MNQKEIRKNHWLIPIKVQEHFRVVECFSPYLVKCNQILFWFHSLKDSYLFQLFVFSFYQLIKLYFLIRIPSESKLESQFHAQMSFFFS